MKTSSKSAIALLTFAALTLNNTSTAAENSTEVLVTATVPAWVKLDTEPTIDLGSIGNVEKVHTIKVSSNNTNPAMQVTVQQKGNDKDVVVLSHTDSTKKDTIDVEVNVKEAEFKDMKFAQGKIKSPVFETTQAGKTMTLVLKPKNDFNSLESGQYQGTLSVTAAIN